VLEPVDLAERSLADYIHVGRRECVEEIRELASALRGVRILHVTPAFDFHPAWELLKTLVPLMRDVGLDAHWRALDVPASFLEAATAIRRAAMGDDMAVGPDQWKTFRTWSERNGDAIEDGWDVIAVHGVEAIGLEPGARNAGTHILWSSQIDSWQPTAEAKRVFDSLVGGYDVTVWRSDLAIPKSLSRGATKVVPLSIDPLAPKNMALARDDTRMLCEQFGVDTERPLLAQVGRFDPPDEAIRAIDVYRRVAQTYPELQLVLAGYLPVRDDVAWESFSKAFEHAGGDPDIKILNQLNNVGVVEIGAFQSQADVVLQHSIRAGFRRGVLEAQWKRRPLVATRIGGVEQQVEDLVTGFLIGTVDEAADRCLQLLGEPALGIQLGVAAGEDVRDRYLVTHVLRDWLELLGSEWPETQSEGGKRESSLLESLLVEASGILDESRLREGPKVEFDAARRELDKGTSDSRKRAVTEVCNAVESILKVLCEERDIPLPKNPSASRLYATLTQHGVLQHEKEALILGPARFGNKRARHGAGRVAHVIDESDVELVLGQAAMAIQHLVRRLP
jgi:trehalose synthase